MYHAVRTVVGLLVFSEEGRLVDVLRYDKPEEVLDEPELTREEAEFLQRLGEEVRCEGVHVFPGMGGELFRSRVREVLEELGVEEAEYRRRVHACAIALSRRRLRRALGSRDMMVKQLVSALEELEEVQNLLTSRLREWYFLHFPEAAGLEELPELVARYGSRENMRGVEGVGALAEASAGAGLERGDIEVMRSFASRILELRTLREELKRRLEEVLLQHAPNLCHLAGTPIAGRLISAAGSLERLARMPGSRIQVLGAEKALFRHLARGAKPPKHGYIYQHPFVKGAPRRERGRRARALAAKLAIAARADAYGGRFIAEELERRLKKGHEA